MRQLNLWLALLGGLTLLLGLAADAIKRYAPVPTQPIVAVLVGVAVGPHGLDVLRVTPLAESLPLLEQLARVTVAFAVASIALRLEPGYFRDRAQSLVAILGPGMLGMWALSSLVAYAVLPVDPLVALLVGAVVTPTDPVLANAIVVGQTAKESIPKRLRYLLSAEAGINDGAAYLFVFLPLLLVESSPERALTDWVLTTLLHEVVGAVIVGLAFGLLVGRIEHAVSERGALEETSVFSIVVALTLFVLGATKLLGTTDILGVFVAGAAYNWQAEPRDEVKEQRVEEVFNELLTVPVFVVFGMVLPWSAWLDLGWRGPALMAGVLLFRRLPVILAIRGYVPALDPPAASLFVGWFGPIGPVAAFYAILATERTGTELVWTAGSLVVAGSVLVHGMTSTLGTQWYGSLADSDEGR